MKRLNRAIDTRLPQEEIGLVRQSCCCMIIIMSMVCRTQQSLVTFLGSIKIQEMKGYATHVSFN